MEIQEPKDKPAETPTPAAKPEDNFRFPAITDKTICLQIPGTGDVWLGFNPARFYPRVVLAWAAFQIENAYANVEDRIRAARAKGQGQHEKKEKKSLLQILSGK